MKLLKVTLLMLVLGAGQLWADAAKVVYDVTSGDSKKIEKYLIKSIQGVAEYYKNEKREFEAIVVISGDAYKFFIEDLKNSPYSDDLNVWEVQDKFKPLLQNLSDTYHVTFNMCSVGMQGRGVKPETLYKYVHSEKMKSIYLIDAQNDGYAYMPIH